jgi:hypothetical protein
MLILLQRYGYLNGYLCKGALPFRGIGNRGNCAILQHARYEVWKTDEVSCSSQIHKSYYPPPGDEVSLLLSGDEQFRFSRPDWLLILLSLVSKETGAQISILVYLASKE